MEDPHVLGLRQRCVGVSSVWMPGNESSHGRCTCSIGCRFSPCHQVASLHQAVWQTLAPRDTAQQHLCSSRSRQAIPVYNTVVAAPVPSAETMAEVFRHKNSVLLISGLKRQR